MRADVRYVHVEIKQEESLICRSLEKKDKTISTITYKVVLYNILTKKRGTACSLTLIGFSFDFKVSAFVSIDNYC